MNAPSFLRALTLAILVPLGAAAGALAQPAGARNGLELATRYSHTGWSELESAGPAGTVAIDSLQLALRSSTALSQATRLLYGLEWSYHGLERSGPRWLPGTMESLAVPLGVSHGFDNRWRLLATASPRFAGAGGGLGSAGFDLPVMALASYTSNPDLTWSFGVLYAARSDIKILPIAGVVWKFAPEWEFRLAWPETGLAWRATPQLTLRAIASFHGGDFHVEDDPRAPAGRTGASLDDSWLEYREIRSGFAVEYAMTRRLSLRADLGSVVYQHFEYLDRGHELDGGTPAFFSLSAVGRF